MAQISKPFVLVTSMSAMGHCALVRATANGLPRRGYEVTILTGPRYRESAEEMGATFVAFGGHLSTSTSTSSQNTAQTRTGAVADAITKAFVKAIPDLRACSTSYDHSKDPYRPIVSVNECSFLGPPATTLILKVDRFVTANDWPHKEIQPKNRPDFWISIPLTRLSRMFPGSTLER